MIRAFVRPMYEHAAAPMVGQLSDKCSLRNVRYADLMDDSNWPPGVFQPWLPLRNVDTLQAGLARR